MTTRRRRVERRRGLVATLERRVERGGDLVATLKRRVNSVLIEVREVSGLRPREILNRELTCRGVIASLAKVLADNCFWLGIGG